MPSDEVKKVEVSITDMDEFDELLDIYYDSLEILDNLATRIEFTDKEKEIVKEMKKRCRGLANRISNNDY